MYGQDWLSDDKLFNVPRVKMEASSEGLSARFERVVGVSELNEDPEPKPGSGAGARDGLYARVTYVAPKTAAVRPYITPTINVYVC